MEWLARPPTNNHDPHSLPSERQEGGVFIQRLPSHVVWDPLFLFNRYADFGGRGALAARLAPVQRVRSFITPNALGRAFSVSAAALE